jgi:hypothetical protein
MSLEHYKAASEHTDEAERLLIPPFKRTIETWVASIEAEDEALVEQMRGAEELPYTTGEALARRKEELLDGTD